ncbi:VTT domain-containing protein [Caproicibacter sp.]|uniref:VTT domain-containing protein n=1 Tax=Caproicibacter sp. TaxID=2814884 RepID=UPI003989B26D
MNVQFLFDLFLHLDRYLSTLFSQYPFWAYWILFLIIFIETGLVVTPFLPGDSLIFTTGAIAAASGQISVPFVLLLLYVAAVAGDTANYYIGCFFREKVNQKKEIRFIKAEYLTRTQAFFDRNGGKTITVARFIPIIRTFAPFVAGACTMSYPRFLGYNIVGGIAWVSLLFYLGFFFGNIGYVKSHFGLVVIAIIVLSVIPGAVSFVKSGLAGSRTQREQSSQGGKKCGNGTRKKDIDR